MVRKVGDRYQANAKVDGRRVRPMFDTEAEAELFERDPKAEQIKPTVGPLFRHGYRFLWERERNHRDNYYTTESLIRWLGEDRAVITITAALIQDYVLDLRKENSGPRINRKLTTLRQLLKHCVSRGAMAMVPAFPKREVEGEGRTRFLTEGEAEDLLSRLAPHHRAFATFLLNTGCRIGESLSLGWRDVGEDRLTLRWETTKGKKSRVLGLNRAAGEALAFAREQGWERPWSGIDYDGFHSAFMRAKAEVGLKDDPEVVPHILRHTYASWLVQRGVSIQKVSKLLGHSTITMTMRYAKLADDDLLTVNAMLDTHGLQPVG
jgi:integrase